MHNLDERGMVIIQWELGHAKYIGMWNTIYSSFPYHTQIQAGDFDWGNSQYLLYYRNNVKPYMTTLEGQEECRKYKNKWWPW
ncbi:hypothetical protein GQ457_15G021770 [Hibiscus cannabinus]